MCQYLWKRKCRGQELTSQAVDITANIVGGLDNERLGCRGS